MTKLEQVKLLWKLQELEGEIARKENDLRNIPSVKVYHDCKKKVAALRETLHSQKERIDSTKKELRRGEMNLQNITATISDLHGKLYGGEVHSTRELENMEKRIIALQAEQSAMEENILFLMEELEKYELETSRLDTREGEEYQQLKQIKKQAQQEMQASREELVRLSHHQDDIIEQVKAPLLRKYRDLSRKMQGQCISLVQGGYCGICNVSLPSAFHDRLRRPGELVFCENCGALLLLKDN